MRRSLHVKQWIGAMVLCAALGSVAAAAQPVPYLPVPAGAAVIFDTGSTNASGYRIVIGRTGAAEFVDGSMRASGHVDADLTGAFFRHASEAMPLSKMRIAPCMKSVSFGSSMYVWWRGQRSPDLMCPGSTAAAGLARSASSIAAALGVTSTPRGHLIQPLPNEPRKPLPSPGPAR
jgi:hypothetical protein